MNDIQGSYTVAAADYHAILKDYHRADPFETGALDYFAQTVAEGPVGDLGCGTGRITSYLAGRGMDVFGVDLTPGMIEVARREYPELRFEVGSLYDLDLKDGELAGALAWYSLVHTPREDLPAVFAELFRVLRPGGHLVHGFKVGSGSRELRNAYGHDIDLEVYMYDVADVAGLLAKAGFTEVATLTRAALPGEKDAGQAAHLVRKPATP
ncbi:class I SAM-dependent methyltransferase [Kribbella speibonae]|uniref:Class I SAM-dependent methyltransferase n=1 Tax=Kribbella speibonae TaxID=1572660 RepID=A0A4R0IVT0_9ACTN|nr:class I SAM-dependent methyltransferase [Kribbella speibonae]TCC32855.1 class I SAM-dependent methyltransferase [Kribbella speibonae]